ESRDRLGGVLRSAEDEHLLAGGEQRLVEHVQPRAVPAQRRRGVGGVRRGGRGDRIGRGHRARWYAVPAALSVSGLEKAYGPVHALVGVDLEVAEGELVGLLGPNGAGKSTLVKVACGLVTPTAGRAEVCGEPAGSEAAHASL